MVSILLGNPAVFELAVVDPEYIQVLVSRGMLDEKPSVPKNISIEMSGPLQTSAALISYAKSSLEISLHGCDHAYLYNVQGLC
jgi:hypothetical protein